MLSKIVNCATVIFVLLVSTESARILAMFPSPFHSHHVVLRSLTNSLVERGHEVFEITANPARSKIKTSSNITEIDVSDLAITFWKENFIFKGFGNKKVCNDFLNHTIRLYWIVCAKILKHEDVQKLLQDQNKDFDLLLLEAYFKPTLVLSHFYKVPVILVNSLGPTIINVENIGAPSHPINYPTFSCQRLYNLTLWEKISNVYNYFLFRKIHINCDEKKLFGADIPTTSELNGNINMLSINIHPIWDNNRPVPPSVVYLRGIHFKNEEELPQDLKHYLDSSVNGVIYMSFGSGISPSLLPPDKIQMFVRVLSQLPYDVLLKWDKDELPGLSDNIKIGNWFPQSDLLRHPKIKLFITQGGQSTDEALAAGVPLVGIPMKIDQWYNVEKYAHHRIGAKLDFESIDDEQFKDAIKTVIEDESYRRNVVKLNALMCDSPQRALDRATHWIEHVLHHGGASHLRTPAADMPWTEYFLLDLVLFVTFILITFIYFTRLLFYYVLSLFWKNNNARPNLG